jgi:hypothetical protein
MIDVHCFAQSVTYHYDENGNRDTRTLVELKSTNSSSKNQSSGKDTCYIDSMGDLKITIFPNPTEGVLKIKIENLKANVNSQILVYDFSGKLIEAHNDLNETNILNFSEFSNGTYIVRILIGDQISEWKIIKE